MTKIDIISGFLGAGKTTLIKKLLKEAYKDEKVVLIENEFGEIGIDGGFLRDAGVEITEMNSGCICCSLVGDFTKALEKVIFDYAPDRVIIEPSGVGKLSDVIKAAGKVVSSEISLNSFTTVVDAGKCKVYSKNFGEFFLDQIKNASSVILSHTDVAKPHKIEESIAIIREYNEDAVIISTPIESLTGAAVLSAMEKKNTIENELERLKEAHHHHHHDHDGECECGCHEHHHHDHGKECECGSHEHHHHEHDGECECGCHEHHHHHADEVFSSVGVETAKTFTKEKIEQVLSTLDEGGELGTVLRAKGILPSESGEWIHFDYVPGEIDIRFGSAEVIGRLCVIGAGINKEKIKELFGV